MNPESRFEGTLRYVAAHWPAYLVGYGGSALLALLFALFAAGRNWWSFVLLALALLLVLGYFSIASLWTVYQQYDRRQNWTSHRLFELGQLQPTDDFVHVGLGLRATAIRLARRLTSGHLTVVDVYNPQLAPGRALARARRLSTPFADPRLTWLDGTIDLLPLPDNSAEAVTLSRTLGELWQRGDQQLLLQEIFRILAPGGRLLLAESVRSRRSFFLMGLTALRLQPPFYWRELLKTAGFRVEKEENVGELVHYYRAEKPLPGEMEQLTFDFGL